MWNIHVATVGGRSAELAMAPSATIVELRGLVEGALGLPAWQQQLFLDSGEIGIAGGVAEEMATLEDLGVRDESAVNVIARGPIPLPSSPFSLTLTNFTYRNSKRHLSFPPFFTIRFVINVYPAEDEIVIEVWRKDDHDQFTINTIDGTMRGVRGHLHAGDLHVSSSVDFKGGLPDLMHSWTDKLVPVLESDERIWSVPQMLRDRPESVQPFVAPSADCREFIVSDKKLIATLAGVERVLLNAEGRPVRAALRIGRAAHEGGPIEEYDVEFMVFEDE
jgi:hypothetical protein